MKEIGFKTEFRGQTELKVGSTLNTIRVFLYLHWYAGPLVDGYFEGTNKRLFQYIYRFLSGKRKDAYLLADRKELDDWYARPNF